MTPSQPSQSDSVLRGALTIAEDALHAIAAPDCGLERDEDSYLYYDTGAAGRIAEGALRRIADALEGSDA